MFEPLKVICVFTLNSQNFKITMYKNFLIKMSKISLKLSLNGCVEACGCSQGNCVTDTQRSRSAPAAESVRNVREWRVHYSYRCFWMFFLGCLVSGVFMRGVNVVLMLNSLQNTR